MASKPNYGLAGGTGFATEFFKQLLNKRALLDEDERLTRAETLRQQELDDERAFRDQTVAFKMQELGAAAERDLAEQDYRNQQLELLRGKSAQIGTHKIGGLDIPITSENAGDLMRYLGDAEERKLRGRELDLRSTGKYDSGGGRTPPSPAEMKLAFLKDLAGMANSFTDDEARQQNYDFYHGKAQELLPDIFGAPKPLQSPEELAIQGANTREEAQAMLAEIKRNNPKVFSELDPDALRGLIDSLPSTGLGPKKRLIQGGQMEPGFGPSFRQ